MLFKFTRRDPVMARSAIRNGDLVEVTEGVNRIQLGQWYVIDGDRKFVMSDKSFRAKYDPVSMEAKLHMEDPTKVIVGSM